MRNGENWFSISHNVFLHQYLLETALLGFPRFMSRRIANPGNWLAVEYPCDFSVIGQVGLGEDWKKASNFCYPAYNEKPQNFFDIFLQIYIDVNRVCIQKSGLKPSFCYRKCWGVNKENGQGGFTPSLPAFCKSWKSGWELLTKTSKHDIVAQTRT